MRKVRNFSAFSTRSTSSQVSFAQQPPHSCFIPFSLTLMYPSSIRAPSPIKDVRGKTSLLFSISDKVGGLQEALSIFSKHKLNMTRIESRPSKTPDWDYDFFVDFEGAEQEDLKVLVDELKNLGIGITDSTAKPQLLSGTSNSPVAQVPWFPRHISDLDEFSHKTLDCGEELSADHPGFTDQTYRDRRAYITKVAQQYAHGEKIPRIEYTEDEIKTWGVVYDKLKALFPTHACRQYNYVFPLLEANCGYSRDNIPQLEDISRFLQKCTGWRLRPVTGLLSARDFLNGLAFRVFHSTQYIRHHSMPLYTPEPDVCHELLGHVPLFADPDFADFSQEIGLASLGASDEDIEKLATCYWFTVEFGLCKEESSLKAYGAGLLSSFGELAYSIGGGEKKPEYQDFEPLKTAFTKYPITTYQPLYFVSESFQSAKEKMVQFANTLDRPFSVRYNAITQSVEILDAPVKLLRLAKDLQSSLGHLVAAISKMSGTSN